MGKAVELLISSSPQFHPRMKGLFFIGAVLGAVAYVQAAAPQNRDGCMKIDHGDCDWHSDCCDGLKCDYDWGWKTDYCVAGPETRDYSWGAWTEWTDCSVSCGGQGTQTRSRDCIGPVKGGRECPKAVDTETRECHAPACWTEFGEWSSCSLTCGGTGTQTRVKTCIEPSEGGQACPAESKHEETQPCDAPACWEDWGHWSACSVSCGGTGTKTRSKSCIAPSSGGLPCPEESTKTEDLSCDAPACWEDWGEWSSCVGSCGTTGVKSRTRSCIAPTEGGLACPEESTETENQHCETNPCCSTSVIVTDATSGDAIEGAQVTFTIGDEAAQTLDSGSDGTVALGSLEMQTGVAVKIQKQFYDDNNDAIVVGDSCGSPIDMPMNPQSIDGRIVLTWSSDAPKDLDVYMPSNQQCDLKYNNKACGQNTLDKDNTKGGSTGGPETIAIKEYADDGKYMVYVHQYSRSGSMCTARAKVTIYPGNSAPSQEVHIPTDCAHHRYWFVGCFEGSSWLNAFTPKNQLTESAPTLDMCN